MRAISRQITACFQRGGKLLICGNGGSAAMAQHMAAEFVGRIEHERQPLPAIALTVDTSIITACANDFGFEKIFERQVLALGKPGDILLVFSTSGKSKNCILAIKAAKKLKMEIIDFPRKGTTTAKIQEYQLVFMHDVVREVEGEYI